METMVQKKICLLGPTGVGKTSLVKQFVEGIFSDKYLTTIGVKVDKHQLELPQGSVQFMLWDIEGIDRYCGFNPKYLRGASAYIIVVDQTRAQSLIEGMEIFQMARDNCDALPVLAINKADLAVQWHWSEEEIQQQREQFSQCFDTSAKTGQNVNEMFEYIGRALLEDI